MHRLDRVSKAILLYSRSLCLQEVLFLLGYSQSSGILDASILRNIRHRLARRKESRSSNRTCKPASKQKGHLPHWRVCAFYSMTSGYIMQSISIPTSLFKTRHHLRQRPDSVESPKSRECHPHFLVERWRTCPCISKPSLLESLRRTIVRIIWVERFWEAWLANVVLVVVTVMMLVVALEC